MARPSCEPMRVEPANPGGPRVETGPLKIGTDWTGTFIRGDDAFGLSLALQRMLDSEEARAAVEPLDLLMLENLLRLLQSSREYPRDD